MTAKTKFANGQSPFEPKKAPKPKPAPRPRTPLDLGGIEKCSDPYDHVRVVKQQKYDALFAGVNEGDCFKVPGGEAERSALARALRVYLERRGIEGIVRQNGRCEDGIGRVWLLKIVGRKGVVQ
jgi:hypothetical protein